MITLKNAIRKAEELSAEIKRIGYISAIRAAKKHNLEIIGEGTGRVVVKYGYFVIKIPKSRQGVIANNDELMIYRLLPVYERRFFAKSFVIVGKGLLVSRYIRHQRYCAYTMFPSSITRIINKYKHYDPLKNDMHLGNVVRKSSSGAPIIIDYGRYRPAAPFDTPQT